MGGGLMQLVAYGAQDVYLTGDPEITFFKAIYRRHTNFSVEAIAQVFNGATGFGRKATVTISRNGDLITNTYLEVVLPALPATWMYRNNIGHSIIEEVELEIGGQRIDRHYGEWLDIWSELSLPSGKKEMFDSEMIGRNATNTSNSGATRTLYIPLQFFFNRNHGLALPLIALQYHEVKINFTFAKIDDLVYKVDLTGKTLAEQPAYGTAPDVTMSLYVDYVYLDTDERKRFAQSQHELLIEQLQFTGDESTSENGSYRLNFNHPVKELVWVVSQPTKENKFNYGDAVEPVKEANLQLNGHDRFDKRKGSYFRLVQPFQHHTRIPSKHIYVYSFAVKPEEHQPSGTCNFSRIDNATLKLQLDGTVVKTDNKVKIFATSVNVLRILSGMGGLAYSN